MAGYKEYHALYAPYCAVDSHYLRLQGTRIVLFEIIVSEIKGVEI